MRFATKAIRVAQEPETAYQSVINPIYQTSTFAWNSLDEVPSIDYTRCQNPNRLALEQVIAALEGGKQCVCYSSGMAAVTAAFSLLESGDHLLMASDIYGGTYRLAHQQLPRQGVTVGEFDSTCPDSLIEAIRPESKLLIFESPTNPVLRVADIRKIVEIAKAKGILTVFDNTFASPALMNPIDYGVDLVVHSTTKYITGHSDVIGGAVVAATDELGQKMLDWIKNVGSNPSPFDCWLSLRGLKTLNVRMRQHCENAQRVAEFLAHHPKVELVHYPGLPSHPDHQVAKKQMRGFGGMVSFAVAGTEAQARRVAESTEVFILAESLGGVESLIGYPPLMSHAIMPEAERLARGITPNLLRLSVGIEDAEDLIEDLDRALKTV